MLAGMIPASAAPSKTRQRNSSVNVDAKPVAMVANDIAPMHTTDMVRVPQRSIHVPVKRYMTVYGTMKAVTSQPYCTSVRPSSAPYLPPMATRKAKPKPAATSARKLAQNSSRFSRSVRSLAWTIFVMGAPGGWGWGTLAGDQLGGRSERQGSSSLTSTAIGPLQRAGERTATKTRLSPETL